MSLHDGNRPNVHITNTPPDERDGRNLWYDTTMPIARGRAVSYIAKIDSTDEYTGDLSLRFQLTTGHTPTVRTPFQIREHRDVETEYGRHHLRNRHQHN